MPPRKVAPWGWAIRQTVCIASAMPAIILDLSELSFIDSSGLAAVLDAARRSDEDGNRLRVVAGHGHVAELLKLTGIDEVVRLLD
jgi:anti-sigma B factor antagonist